MSLQYSVVAQGNPIGELTRDVTRTTVNGVDVVKSKGTMSGMQTMNAELVFEAKSFAPVSANMSVQAGGQEMNQILSVADGKITGTLQTPQQPETKEIDAEFAEGTLLPGMDEFAIWLHDWSASEELTLHLYNPASGSVVPITIKRTGESTQTVPAGEFEVYELDMKTAQGAMKGYVRKKAPHILIKQEFLAAPIVIELKTLN